MYHKIKLLLSKSEEVRAALSYSVELQKSKIGKLRSEFSWSPTGVCVMSGRSLSNLRREIFSHSGIIFIHWSMPRYLMRFHYFKSSIP